MIFTHPRDLYSRFIEDIRTNPPTWVYILTYGLWAGVNLNGSVVADNCAPFRLFNYLNIREDIKTRVLVGYENNPQRVCFGTSRRFRNLKFITVQKMHSKIIIASNGLCAIGSANINDTSWGEVIWYGLLDTRGEDFEKILDHIRQQEHYGSSVDNTQIVDISGILEGV